MGKYCKWDNEWEPLGDYVPPKDIAWDKAPVEVLDEWNAQHDRLAADAAMRVKRKLREWPVCAEGDVTLQWHPSGRCYWQCSCLAGKITETIKTEFLFLDNYDNLLTY